MNLKSIPAEVFQLTDLETLILTGNSLDGIGDEIEKLQSLKTLHLVNCNLSSASISSKLWGLPNLKVLNLCKNSLDNIDNVASLKSLTFLNVSQNELMEIPENICELENLEVFDISSNNISAIPNSLSKLPNLKKIVFLIIYSGFE